MTNADVDVDKIRAKSELTGYLRNTRVVLMEQAGNLLKLKAYLGEDIRDLNTEKLMHLLNNFNNDPLAERYDNFENIWPLNKLTSSSRGQLLGDYNLLLSSIRKELQNYHQKRRLLETIRN